MTRVDPPLSEEFRKSPADEDLLKQLNATLAPMEESGYRDVGEPYPTIHVVGVPRSGTTLATQLVSQHLPIGWITNLAAAFFEAPVHGLRLSQMILGWPNDLGYESTYGRTQHPAAPHEFGYFWSRVLGYSTMTEPPSSEKSSVDWQHVRTVLTNMTLAIERPIVFKSFMVGFYAAAIAQVLPRSTFVLVERDPLENALSILRMRRRFTGSVDNWVGVRPAACSAVSRSPEQEVACQVVHGHRAYVRALTSVDEQRIVRIRYEEMCKNPLASLEAVRNALLAAGCDLPIDASHLPLLTTRKSNEADSRTLNSVATAIEQALLAAGST